MWYLCKDLKEGRELTICILGGAVSQWREQPIQRPSGRSRSGNFSVGLEKSE